ncbi:DUF659 domain-containing protein [Cephalotus follicularis]|uniref:DUF659 domain-containing protein n=1 Tax=Cephalotus follicularis TaxID=3775 RepID=A0A1Q3DB12_CEPFO|nr:DUF659 domain-containing protein [Cephalotus follicularis]
MLGATQSEKGKQTTLNDAYKKELREKACADLARWMYEAAIPFNVINFDSFRVAIESVGRYGVAMKPPGSYDEVRGPLLKKEAAQTDEVLKSHKEEWARSGCSIMSDGWQDKSNRTLINFWVNCSKGSMFLESVDASSYMKTGEKFKLLEKVIQAVGEANVVQVITDNGPYYVLAGKNFEAKYPNLYWTPCAAHCVDLILEDIGKLPAIMQTIKRVIELNGYIYNLSSVLHMMRRFTGQRNLLRRAKTRFSTSFITLSSLYK